MKWLARVSQSQVCMCVGYCHWLLMKQRESQCPLPSEKSSPARPSLQVPHLSPRGSVRCCPRSGWTAGCVWTPLPSARQCPETYSCFRSVGRCTWASCQRHSPSLLPASSSQGCAGLIPRWSKQNLPKSDNQSEKLTQNSHTRGWSQNVQTGCGWDLRAPSVLRWRRAQDLTASSPNLS